MILIAYALAAISGSVAAASDFAHVITATAQGTRDNDRIAKAFADDGWRVSEKVVTRTGSRGFFVEHTSATTLDSGKPKKAYYVEGSAFEMGYLHGALSAKIGDAYQTCSTYLHHMPLNLLDETWDQEMAAQCEGWVPGQSQEPVIASGYAMSCETYEALLDGIEKWLVSATRASYDRENEKIPPDLIEEMKGYVSGAQEYDANAGCTFNKMLYLNYGIDVLMSSLYTGQLPSVLAEYAAVVSPHLSARVLKEIASMPPALFRNPVLCNAFGAVRSATKTGENIFMGRDFQMPTGLVYQTIAADVIYVPTDGRYPSVSSGAPGFVGRVTGMNVHGVTMGVDMLFAAPNTPYSPGLNSLLLVRHVLDYAQNTAEAVEIIASAPRGVTWLYPICDGQGECVVIESGKYTPEGTPFAPLQYVNNSKVLTALPSAEFFVNNPSPCKYDRGIFVRPMDFQYPSQYLDFNEGLFAVGEIPYDDSDESKWGETGSLFSSFEEDANVTGCCLHSNFFEPQRETLDDLILISNVAITPEFRTASMSYAANAWQKVAHSAVWRYDELNKLLVNSWGTIDIDTALYIMEFLSPERTPGYWTNMINASDPMSAMVEGTMNVADITELRLHSKCGYWADSWTALSLKNYV